MILKILLYTVVNLTFFFIGFTLAFITMKRIFSNLKLDFTALLNALQEKDEKFIRKLKAIIDEYEYNHK